MKSTDILNEKYFISLQRFVKSIICVMLISACSPITRYNSIPPERLLDQKEAADRSEDSDATVTDQDKLATRFQETPKPEISELAVTIDAGKKVSITGEPISLNIDSMPLPAFINEVFGNLLNQSFQISPNLSKKQDLVTIRIVEPVAPTDLYYAAKQVLDTYGVTILTESGILRFNLSQRGGSAEPPLIISGQALPTVPITHRPVFFVVPLKVVKNNNAAGWLKEAFAGQSLIVTQDPYRNAIWLKGKQEVVAQAAKVLKILDKPLMRGQHSLRIEPVFLGADKLVERLIDVLRAEGYDATTKASGTINFLPIDETNSIIVFATDKSALTHVRKWVIELDKPLKQTKADNIFFYPVQNILARSISDVLNQVGTSGGTAKVKATSDVNNSSGTVSGAARMLVVDEGRNALLFKGNAEQWAALLPIIKKMDQPALQVLLEVTVAEVKLSEDFSFGIEWAINNASLPGDVADIAKNAINIGSNGISYYPMNSSGSTRAVLNALAGNSNVKLLQTPRILVRSGAQASINVGDEVPIVTAQSSSPQQEGGTNALLQSVQYRKTGNTLTITPVIYPGGQVDIELSQEISSAQKTSTSELNSPTILNRSLNTSFTVKNGGSVLVGGLIQTEDVEGETRVPFLSDIPFIGKLFTQQTMSSSRTELMILVVPYIIRDNLDAKAVTEAFNKRLDWAEE